MRFLECANLFGIYYAPIPTATIIELNIKISTVLLFPDALSIDIDNENPLHVANCTPVTFVCRLTDKQGSNKTEVYWSFRGENASKLPGVNTSFDGDIALLDIPCPERNYTGVYQCLAEEKNTSIIYKKELSFNVYGEYFSHFVNHYQYEVS